MPEDIFRVSFRQYFWTPLPFIFLLLIALLEGCIASQLLKREVFNKHIIITFLISNITGYFVEYFLSVLLNGGFTLLVWVPWVKIIGTKDLFVYAISFPIIFIVTLLVEGLMNWLLLTETYSLSKIFKATFLTNFISLIILIVTFNCIVFNIIKGEEIRITLKTFDDFLPEPVFTK